MAGPHGPTICASFSYIHYRYEVDMLKVPALGPYDYRKSRPIFRQYEWEAFISNCGLLFLETDLFLKGKVYGF